MNYRHAFHAGNFADVLKHIFIARALTLLTRKDTPLRFIDTHAGAGRYEAGFGTVDAGQWDLVIELSRGEEKMFVSRNRLILK